MIKNSELQFFDPAIISLLDMYATFALPGLSFTPLIGFFQLTLSFESYQNE